MPRERYVSTKEEEEEDSNRRIGARSQCRKASFLRTSVTNQTTEREERLSTQIIYTKIEGVDINDEEAPTRQPKERRGHRE